MKKVNGATQHFYNLIFFFIVFFYSCCVLWLVAGSILAQVFSCLLVRWQLDNVRCTYVCWPFETRQINKKKKKNWIGSEQWILMLQFAHGLNIIRLRRRIDFFYFFFINHKAQTTQYFIRQRLKFKWPNGKINLSPISWKNGCMKMSQAYI